MAGILLVEDEGAIREKIMKNVDWTAHGFAPVLGAANGLEALELLQNYPVEIMVTDIQMPKMNGIELIKEVKKRGYQLKIIVISGFAEFEYARESITLNVCEYLLKPFATKRLLDVAVRLLEEIRKEQAEELELNELRTQINDLRLDHPGYQKSLYLLYQNKVFDNLRIGAHDQIHHNLKSLFEEMRSSQLNPENIRIIGANLVLLACATLNELGYNPEEIFTGGFPSLSEISHTESLKELEEVITEFFTRINLMISEKRDSVNKQMIDEIRRYLEENYASEITLSAIAAQHRISPGYLSLLFTERTGKISDFT